MTAAAVEPSRAPARAATSSALVAALVVGAAAIDAWALVALLVVVGVAAVIDGASLLQRQAARPVLPAALVPVVALPILAGVDAERAASLLAAWYAGAFLLAALLLLVGGRRRGATLALGSTMALAGLVGLGVLGLVLLADGGDALAWLGALALLVVAADVPPRLAAWRGLTRRARGLAALAAVVFATAALVGALGEALAVGALLGVAATVLVAARAAAVLWPVAEGRPHGALPGALVGGNVLAAVGTLLLASPVAALLVWLAG